MIKVFYILIFSFLSYSSVMPMCWAEGSLMKEKVKIILSLKERLKPEDEIQINLKIKNDSLSAISIMESSPIIDFDLDVIDDDGNKVQLTEYGLNIQKHKEDSIFFARRLEIIKSGDSKEYTINLSQIYKIHLKEVVTVRASRSVTFVDGSSLNIHTKTTKTKGSETKGSDPNTAT